MSSDSGSAPTPFTPNRAFTKVDVKAFRESGGRLASTGKRIGISKRDRLSVGPSGNVSPGVLPSEITNLSDQEVQKLVDIFRIRSEEIETRRLSPGITQTRLLGR